MEIKRGQKTVEIKAKVPHGLTEAKAMPEDMRDLEQFDLKKWERDQRARGIAYQRRIFNGPDAA